MSTGSFQVDDQPAGRGRERTFVNLVAVSRDGRDVAHLVKNDFPPHLAGRVTFPGGKTEDTDESVAHAAAREAFEEGNISVDPREVIVLRRVDTPYGPLYNCFAPADLSQAHTRTDERVFVKAIDSPLESVTGCAGLRYADDHDDIMAAAMPRILELRRAHAAGVAEQHEDL